MSDDWVSPNDGNSPGEGLYPNAVNGPWSWGGILAYTVDMYGGIGGQMLGSPDSPGPQMAQGGVTGPPDEWGGSSGYVGGGNSSTPPSGGGGSTPPHGGGDGSSPQAQFQQQIKNQIAAQAAASAREFVNSGKWGVPGFGWSWTFPTHPWTTDWFVAGGGVGGGGGEVGPPYGPGFGYGEYPHGVQGFPGNPANDNKPSGPNGTPHNWDSYRKAARPTRVGWDGTGNGNGGNPSPGYFGGSTSDWFDEGIWHSAPQTNDYGFDLNVGGSLGGIDGGAAGIDI